MNERLKGDLRTIVVTVIAGVILLIIGGLFNAIGGRTIIELLGGASASRVEELSDQLQELSNRVQQLADDRVQGLADEVATITGWSRLPPPPDVIVDVIDNAFVVGGDEIDVVFANRSESPILVEENATLRVDDVYCPVSLRGQSPIDPGETEQFVVDGSMRIVSSRIPDAVPQPCELRFDIRRLGSDGGSETRFFDFMCERNRVPNLDISGSNLCE